ncbi:hypothetical protein LINPERPRIM_LOCUS23811, partial [Linum perenne]
MSTDGDHVVPHMWNEDDDDAREVIDISSDEEIIYIDSDDDDEVIEVINIESDVEVIDLDPPTPLEDAPMHWEWYPFMENFEAPGERSVSDLGGDSPPYAWLDDDDWFFVDPDEFHEGDDHGNDQNGSDVNV